MSKCDWKVFSEFADCAFGIWKVTMKSDSNATNYKKGTCTCPTYYKQFICKHVIGIAILKKYVKCDVRAQNVPLGEMRKRGRPCQAPLVHLRRPRASILRGDFVDYEFERDNQLNPDSNEPYEVNYNDQETENQLFLNEQPAEMPFNPSGTLTTLESFTDNFIAENDPTFAADYNTLFHSEDTSSSTDSAFSIVSTNSAVSTTSTSSSSSNLLIVNPRKRGRGKALTEEEKIQRAEIAVQTKAAKIQAKKQKLANK